MLSLSDYRALESCYRAELSPCAGSIMITCDLRGTSLDYDEYKAQISRHTREVKETLEMLGFKLIQKRTWGLKYSDIYGHTVMFIEI